MRAGHALDLLVAKHVVGCCVRKNRKDCYDLIVPGAVNHVDSVKEEGAWASCPKFSSDPSYAFLVVEAMRKRGKLLVLSSDWGPDRKWCASFQKKDAPIWRGMTADRMPLAICLAALQDVGVKVA
jgi:hypothetical protein